MDMLERIRYHLDCRRLAYELFPLPRPGAPLGEVLGFGADQVVRGVLLDADEGPALAVIPADHAIDTAAAAALSGRPFRTAAPDTAARILPGLAPGPIPPLALHRPLPVLVDERIGTGDGVYFPAGEDTLLRMQSDAFQRLHAGALWGDISRRPPYRRRLRPPPREHTPRVSWVATATGSGGDPLRH